MQSPTNTYYVTLLVAPGPSTDVVDPGPAGDAQAIFLWSRDVPGGSGSCVDGPLSAWEGTLKVTTSQRVRR